MINDFSLLETILFSPQTGFYLIDYHLVRLQKAIQDFQQLDKNVFVHPPSDMDIMNELLKHVPLENGFQRVRLLVDTNSKITVESTALPIPEYAYETLDDAAQATPLLIVVLDTEPFSPPNNDPFVLHKTTKRDMYDISRSRADCRWHGENNEPFDVILWNKKEEITETSITNLAIRFPSQDGKFIWKTPSVECGLLPGVFRSHLLQIHANIVEDVITIKDLKHAQENGYPIVCFNSVRKAYRVKLFTKSN